MSMGIWLWPPRRACLIRTLRWLRHSSALETPKRRLKRQTSAWWRRPLFQNEPRHHQITGLQRMSTPVAIALQGMMALGRPPILHPPRGLSVFIGELFTTQGAQSAIEGGTEVSATTSKFVPRSQTIEVDFLYLDLTTCSRCRASDATLDAAVEIVRPVLYSAGASIEIRKTLVETEEQARVLGFVSSPTIRVNGHDIAGELIESSCSECGELCGCDGRVDCRVWDYRGAQHTEAPTGLIVEAILAEVRPSGTARSEETPFVDVPENLKRFFAGTGAVRDASTCCSMKEQATCCDPAEKAGCCGDTTDSSCGCR